MAEPIRIHTLLIGQPKTITDEKGAWESAIFRTPVTGPVTLGERGLGGDQVADTKHHGSPDQAVCCHALAHYAAWNAEFGLEGTDRALGPGAVGENWTLVGGLEDDVCVGDIYQVGTARVQVTGSRFPCWKQERKVGVPGFLKRTMETGRTGLYLRVLTPGTVTQGDELQLVERPHPALTLSRLNKSGLGRPANLDPAEARELIAVPELAAGWKRILEAKLNREWPDED
jgi:Uncharacterized protein conserved in bacteria